MLSFPIASVTVRETGTGTGNRDRELYGKLGTGVKTRDYTPRSDSLGTFGIPTSWRLEMILNAVCCCSSAYLQWPILDSFLACSRWSSLSSPFQKRKQVSDRIRAATYGNPESTRTDPFPRPPSCWYDCAAIPQTGSRRRPFQRAWIQEGRNRSQV